MNRGESEGGFSPPTLSFPPSFPCLLTDRDLKTGQSPLGCEVLLITVDSSASRASVCVGVCVFPSAHLYVQMMVSP